MPAYQRLEIWSDLACAGGARLAFVPDVLALSEERQLSGDDQLTLTLPTRSVAYPQLREQRVLRVAYADGSFDEWIIKGPIDEQNAADSDQRLTATVVAQPPRVVLGRVPVTRTEADGTVVHDFEALQLTPAQHLASFLLPSLTTEGIGYVAAGTLEATAPIDVTYSWESALAVLQRIADQTGTELQLRRDGTAGYLVDLLTSINSGASPIDVRLAKNLVAVKRHRDASQQATRVYPRGVATDGIYATMAHARWRVASVAGATVQLVDPNGGKGPAQFTGQLDGLYALTPGGALTEVTGTTVVDALTTEITLAAAPGWAVGDLVEFRRDAQGTLLTYLEAPAPRATYGLWSGVLDRQDVADTVNALENPAMRSWSLTDADPPDHWTKLGAPTLTRTPTPGRWQTGGQSCRIETAADGEGIETELVPIAPTADQPYFSGYVDFWMAAGRVRVELVATDGVTTWILPDGTDGLAYSTQVETWVQLGVAGIDLQALGATAAQLRIVQDGPGTADVYVDSAQLTQTGAQQAYVEGSGGTQLWQAANEQLLDVAEPAVSYELGVVDLQRLYPALFPSDEILIGAPIRIRDDELGLTATTRVVGRTRNLLVAGDTTVTLSNKPRDLTDELVRPTRPPRRPQDADTSRDLTVQGFFSLSVTTPGTINVKLGARPANARLYYIVQDAGSTVPPVGASDWTAYATQFSVAQSKDVEQQVAAYAQLGGQYSRVEIWPIFKAIAPSVELTLTEPSGGTLKVQWTPNGYVARVRLYRKKGGWPTLDATQTGTLDPASFVEEVAVASDGGGIKADGSPVAGGTSWTEGGYAAADHVYVIVVPIDNNGVPAPRAALGKVMAGAGGGTQPQLSTFSADLTDVGSSCANPAQVMISWTPNAQVSDATHDLEVSVSVDGGPATVIFTEASPQSVTSRVYALTDYQGLGPTHIWDFSYRLLAGATVVDSGAGAGVLLRVSGTCPG